MRSVSVIQNDSSIRVNKDSSQLRGAAATGVPERQDLYAFGICDHAVIDVVMHSREVQTTHARGRRSGRERRSEAELI
jgi:hypothetical protein